MPERQDVDPVELHGLVAACAMKWTDEPVEFIRNFSNLVFRVSGSQRSYLRITIDSHRTFDEIESELQVVSYLAASGVGTSIPIASRSGELIHTIKMDGQLYHACVFSEASGREFAAMPMPDLKAFMRDAGRQMGLLHNTLSSFLRPAGFRRSSWTENRWHRFEQIVPKSEVEAWELYTQLKSWTQSLPREPSLFGLIHGDYTIGNMRIDGSRITMFDFDECCDHWHAYEVAVFLHYFGSQAPAERQLAYDCVLAGYAEHRSISRALLEQIPLFGKMRLLFSFLVFAEEWGGFENLTAPQQSYFQYRRELFRSPPTWPGFATTWTS